MHVAISGRFSRRAEIRRKSGREIKALVEEIGGKVLAVTASIASAALLLACLGVGNVVAAGIIVKDTRVRVSTGIDALRVGVIQYF